MHPAAIRSLVLALGAALASAASGQQDPFVDAPPPPEAICPAIAEGYELCQSDPASGDCADFVDAAHALGRLYLFNVQRQPQREAELQTTVWWQCGSAPFIALKGLLLRIDSPEARAVLAESPYRSLPTPAAARPAPALSGAGGEAPGATDCAASAPTEHDACEQRALAEAQSLHESAVARCEARLPTFMREQFRAAEEAWQTDRDNECMPGDGDRTRCLLEATRRRDQDMADGCGFGGPEQAEQPAEEGPLGGGPQTGMLPARWTPPRGESQEVSFDFENRGRNAVQGTMRTTLGAERFAGEYLRIQESTQGKLVTAMSVGWSGPEWQLWQKAADGKWVEEGMSVGEFAHFYTGKVLATLRGDRGDAMRCQIVLKDPGAGLLYGGSGRCQVTDGGSLTLDF